MQNLCGRLLTIVAAAFAFQHASAANSLVCKTVNVPGQYVFEYGGKPVMIYEFTPGKYKSYVKALHTLRGDNVLRDSPFDHLHHHALMYGIVVGGVNFWEEAPGAGVQKTVSISDPESRRTEGGVTESAFTQVLHWLPASDAFLPDTNARPFLVERRMIRLAVNPSTDEVSVHWSARFKVGSRTNTVVLTGANYHGLGMRFDQELDPGAVHFYPGGKPDLSGNRQDASPHPWEAVLFNAPNRPATLAVFGAAGNARGEPRFFSMRTPFAYLAATQGLDREPLVYREGDAFELTYLVTLYSSLRSEAELSGRAKAWASTGR